MKNLIIIVKNKVFLEVVVTISLRKQSLDLAFENFCHPGIKKNILSIISLNYYSFNMAQDITHCVKHCDR